MSGNFALRVFKAQVFLLARGCFRLIFVNLVHAGRFDAQGRWLNYRSDRASSTLLCSCLQDEEKKGWTRARVRRRMTKRGKDTSALDKLDTMEEEGEEEEEEEESANEVAATVTKGTETQPIREQHMTSGSRRPDVVKSPGPPASVSESATPTRSEKRTTPKDATGQKVTLPTGRDVDSSGRTVSPSVVATQRRFPSTPISSPAHRLGYQSPRTPVLLSDKRGLPGTPPGSSDDERASVTSSTASSRKRKRLTDSVTELAVLGGDISPVTKRARRSPGGGWGSLWNSPSRAVLSASPGRAAVPFASPGLRAVPSTSRGVPGPGAVPSTSPASGAVPPRPAPPHDKQFQYGGRFQHGGRSPGLGRGLGSFFKNPVFPKRKLKKRKSSGVMGF